MKELNLQEQAFFGLYIESMNAPESARLAGYSESVARTHAWSWVSITGCPANKTHLRDAIHDEIGRRFGVEQIDSDWVLRRAKLLADFNIRKFITINDNGDAVYDFSAATDDDWYCVEDYVTEQSFRRIDGNQVPVDKIKIKTAAKAIALKLVGDHVKVQAFREQIEHTGAVAINLTRTVIDP